MVAVAPLRVSATPLLIVSPLQVNVPGVVLLAMTASVVAVGVPLFQVAPFHVVLLPPPVILKAIVTSSRNTLPLVAVPAALDVYILTIMGVPDAPVILRLVCDFLAPP